jgi:hypothetical protein
MAQGVFRMNVKKVIFWGTILSGVAAAYLMYRRGVSLGDIASETIMHPVGSLIHELKTPS